MGFPREALTVLLLRPLSGAGSLAALETLMAWQGPDSRVSMVASVVVGSSETIFYTMTRLSLRRRSAQAAAGAEHIPDFVVCGMPCGGLAFAENVPMQADAILAVSRHRWNNRRPAWLPLPCLAPMHGSVTTKCARIRIFPLSGGSFSATMYVNS